MGSAPAASGGDLPISADFRKKNQKMNVRTIAVISLSAFVLLMILIGAVSIILKWKKFRRPSSAVGPAFTSSINKQSGTFTSFHCLKVDRALNSYPQVANKRLIPFW